MDLTTILARVPPLLDACICNEVDALRILRLVSKGASKVALQGLRSYTLTLWGTQEDSHVNGVKLLKQTRLTTFSVNVTSSGTYSPAKLLQAFVDDMGGSLCAVTCLCLHVWDAGSSSDEAVLMSQALACLAAACPSLTNLVSTGRLPLPVFSTLSSACKQLSELSIIPFIADPTYLPSVILLLPSLLPGVKMLRFSTQELPDMSQNTTVLSLEMRGFRMSSSEHWDRLPSKLQHLECYTFSAGPSAAAERAHTLGSLETVTLNNAHRQEIHVGVVAALLRAAPALRILKCGHSPRDDCSQIEVVLVLTESSIAAVLADLQLLRSKDAIPRIKDAPYIIDCSEGGGGSLQPLIAALPRMNGVTKCKLSSFAVQDLGALLKVFPNFDELSISHQHDMDDFDFQALQAYPQMTSLDLHYCSKITATGVFALCQRAPWLDFVTCHHCEAMTEEGMQKCEQLLRSYGLDVEVELVDY